jgi:hypothetical protein
MATNKRKSTSFSFDQIREVAGGVPGQLDAFRADGFAGLGTVKRAKLVQSRRERARLEAKHGADHPLVIESDRRMANEHQALVAARIEQDRVRTPAAERQDGAWLLHGYVRTREGATVSRATVALYPDADGQQTALVETKSDSQGYFKLVFEQEALQTEPAAPSRPTTGGEVPAEAVESGRPSSGAETPAAPTDTERPGTGAGVSERPGGVLGLTRRALQINTNVAGQGTVAATKPQRLQNGIRINAAIREKFAKEPVYLGATPSGGQVTMVATPLYPAPSMIAYRDIVLTRTGQGGEGCQLHTRFLGNSSTRELHCLDKEKAGCQIEEMRPDHRVYFRNEAEAEALGYDLCAYCYGRRSSKR